MALLTLVDPSFSQYTNAKLREESDRDWAKTGGHCILPFVGLAGLSAGLAAVRLYNVVSEVVKLWCGWMNQRGESCRTIEDVVAYTTDSRCK
jgi:hypothetical protein